MLRIHVIHEDTKITVLGLPTDMIYTLGYTPMHICKRSTHIHIHMYPQTWRWNVWAHIRRQVDS